MTQMISSLLILPRGDKYPLLLKIKSPVKNVTNYQYLNEPAEPCGQTGVGSRNHEQNTSNDHNKLFADDFERRLPAPLPGVVREQRWRG